MTRMLWDHAVRFARWQSVMGRTVKFTVSSITCYYYQYRHEHILIRVTTHQTM